ncbi:MAG: cation diffusion facilitator family transporter, partial [Candidatus Hydrothermarchaeales archaeon]
LLFLLKLVVGILGNSTALIADAMHTLSDIASSVVVFIGFVIGEKPADESHPFGHGDVESIAGLMVAVLIGIIGFEVARSTVERVYFKKFVVPATMALAVAFISILSQEVMARYVSEVGKEINSPSLIADAAHHRSDALSSIIVFFSIIGAKAGYPVLDPLAGFVVSLLILKVAYDVGRENIDLLTGKVMDKDLIERIKDIATLVEGVEGIHSVKVHYIGAYARVELHIEVDREMRVIEADRVAHRVQGQVIKNLEVVKTALVHVCPKKGQE